MSLFEEVYHYLFRYQQPVRRRRSSLITRSLQIQRQKAMNGDDDYDEFAV